MLKWLWPVIISTNMPKFERWDREPFEEIEDTRLKSVRPEPTPKRKKRGHPNVRDLPQEKILKLYSYEINLQKVSLEQQK